MSESTIAVYKAAADFRGDRTLWYATLRLGDGTTLQLGPFASDGAAYRAAELERLKGEG